MNRAAIDKAKKSLSQERYNICFLKGTELPFSGRYTYVKDKGEYLCVVCKTRLFSSSTKYDSGTGWPSFWDVIKSANVKLEPDYSLGEERTEVLCKTCGAHLGHVFDDGPGDHGGKRYCINSLALDFVPKKEP